MADVSQGLTTGAEPELDPNSDVGFNARLARQVGGGEISEAAQAAIDSLGDTDRSITSGLTQESTQIPARDDQGRYAPAAPAEPADEGAAPTEGDEGDTALAEFLERHGGDSQAALAAALREKEEAQSLIGRQGNELGEARKAAEETAELRERLARLEGRAEATPTADFQPVAREQIESAFSEDDEEGWGVMNWAANNRPDLIEDVYQVWKDYYPSDAALWRFRFEENLQRGRQEPVAPEPDPILSEMHAQRQINGVLDGIKAEYNETDWGVIAPHLEETLPSAPKIILSGIASGDAETQADALRGLVEIAKLRAVNAATEKVRAERKEANVAAKKTASVATGSLRPVAPAVASDAPVDREQIRVALRDALLQTDIKDVQQGLVYGQG